MPKLLIHDQLYGEWEITEPVLIDAYNSDAVNRLKKINQLGPPAKYYFKSGFSRFEHSVGVMLFLRLLGASIKEQLAGLLHDTPQTAFSHVYDYFDLSSVKEENFHDRDAINILGKTDLPDILSQHGYDLEDVMDHKNFPLLKSTGKLCADRIDYTFREMPADQVAEILPCLKVHNQQILFTDVDLARKMALATLQLQINHWGSAEGTNRYYHFAQILQTALKNQIIHSDDFFKNDEHIMQKIYTADNPTINNMLDKLATADFSCLQPTDLVLPRKFRYIDPHILINNQIVALSAIDQEYKKSLAQAQLANEQGIVIFQL